MLFLSNNFFQFFIDEKPSVVIDITGFITINYVLFTASSKQNSTDSFLDYNMFCLELQTNFDYFDNRHFQFSRVCMLMFHTEILLHVSLIFIKCGKSVILNSYLLRFHLYILLFTSSKKSTSILKYNLKRAV